MDGFGERLAKLREQSGYSKKDISLMLGFSPNVFGTYEREERRPSLETIIKIADFFHVSLDYLIRGEEFHPQEQPITYEKNQMIVRELLDKGMENPYFLQPEKWKLLSEDDIKEIENHFEWVVKKAEMRRKKS